MVNKQNTRIAEIFHEVQSTRSSRKNVVILRQVLLKDDIRDFTQVFLRCLNRVLICRKSDTNGDRVLKFIAHFISLLESNDDAELTIFGEFTSALIRHLLRGIDSKEKHVRYRVCQLLAFIMTSGLTEIDEDLFEALQAALVKRVRDRESSVRTQAVIALSRFQAAADAEEEEDDEVEEDESATKITEVLLHLLSHDPSADVRRAVLHNLTQSSATLPFLLERARDSDASMRKQIYSTILPSISGFKPLSISKRNKILKWGLRDRDDTVRRAAERMFAVDWLNLANGSILELLQRLDIVNSTVGEDVMKAFFRTRREFIAQFTFDGVFWEDLNPESVFLVRCHNDFALAEGIAEDIADKLPELSSICDLIVRHMNKAKNQSEVEKADTVFVLENLLKLAQHSDLTDEIGRKRLMSNCNEILRSDLNDTLLCLAVEVLSKITFGDKEVTNNVREIITDLYDVLEDEREANESFHSADSDLTERGRSSTPKPNGDHEDSFQAHYIFTTLRVLAIVGSLLKNISSNLSNNPKLSEILKDIIVPAYRSHEGPICEKGIECLGQICLLDGSLAREYLGHFLNCFAKGYEDLKILALKCITDILMAHPTMLSTKTDDQLLDNEDATAAKELGGESSSLEDDLVRVYLKAFQLEDEPEVTSTATQSVSKLLLFNIIPPDSVNARGLLKEMVIMYYSPKHAENESLRQNLAYFFPVYSYSSLEHQEAMVSIVVSVLKKLARLYESMDPDEKSDTVALLSVGNQLLDWTNPSKLVNSEVDQSGQIALIEPMIKRMHLSERDESRVLAAALSKIYIPMDYDVEELLEVAQEALEDCADAISKRSVLRFQANLEKIRTSRQINDQGQTGSGEDAEEGSGDQTTIGEQTMGDTTIASMADTTIT